MLFFAAPLIAQLELQVVQLELASPVNVPAGDVTIVIFLPGNASDPFGSAPPNGDLVFLGGNSTGAVGLVASATCKLTALTDPTQIGFQGVNYLIAGADASGNAVLSNHTDTVTVDINTSLSCIVEDPNGDEVFDDSEHTDNAFAQVYTASTPTTVASILLGIESAVEGNNPLGVDSDGDGAGDSEPVLDGKIPMKVYFFFGDPAPTFGPTGPNGDADAEFHVDLVVNENGCDFSVGDINQDGSIDLLDVDPFIDLLNSGEFQCEGDVNFDGSVDLLDVSQFIVILSGG